MARFQITVDVDPQWTVETRLRVYVGDENAKNLASSTPSGGRLVRQVAAFDDPQETQTVIVFHVAPTDPCAIIPYGVAAVDAAGNESGIFETFDRADDVPDGVDAQAPSATGSANEALIEWQTSDEVELA